METISKYDKQAIDFLNSTSTAITFKFKKHGPHFIGETENRDVWRVTIKNKLGSFSFDFGQSISNVGKQPTAYDVLACLTKYNPGSFNNFCDDFGYDHDSRKAEKIYKAVCKEWDDINRLFSEDQIEQLQGIQ